MNEMHQRRTKLAADVRLMLEKAASLGKSGVKYVSTPKGAKLMHESDVATHAWYICTGRVRIFRITLDGNSIVLAHRSNGDFVGEMAVINDVPRSGSIIAMEDTRSILIPNSVFNEWVFSDVSFSAALVFQLSQRLRESSQHAFSIATVPIAIRLAAELITLAVPMPGTSLSYIPDAPTITDLGARVNATRESVSKAFSALVARGVVSRDKANFIIHDMVTLANMLPD